MEAYDVVRPRRQELSAHGAPRVELLPVALHMVQLLVLAHRKPRARPSLAP